MRKLQNLGIVTFPVSEAGVIPLTNLVGIVRPLAYNLHLVTGNAGYDSLKHDQSIFIKNVRHESGSNLVTRVIKYILTQLRISCEIAQIANKVDLLIFFIGGSSLLLPMLISKFLRKRVLLFLAGSDTEGVKHQDAIFFLPTKLIVRINLSLSNHIALYAPNLIKEYDLEKYRHKISIAHEHFLNFDKFRMEKRLNERRDLVGYIGRLSEEKGTLNFIKAIPEILKEQEQVKFLVGGEGQLQDKIQKYLDEEGLNGKVKLPGWIGHDALPNYLNELQLLVLPSYTEGLPNIMLEAMACGTPVLATPVGAVPDVIRDGETGFIMNDNSPECIANNVIRALNHPSLEQIVRNAHTLVKKEFTYEAAVEKYKDILASLR